MKHPGPLEMQKSANKLATENINYNHSIDSFTVVLMKAMVWYRDYLDSKEECKTN